MAEASDLISPAIRDALNWLEYGVLVVNTDARVSFINSRAQELLPEQHQAARSSRCNVLAGL